MYSVKIVTLVSAVLLAITLLFGCGSDDSGPVYDTASNPYQLPDMAVNLLDSLEHDRLVGLEAVTSAFGDLYGAHSELLDRSDWKKVIDRLGGMFSRKADSLKELGLNSYTIAAEYFQLASFARPNDDQLAYQAKSFGSWLRVNNDTSVVMQKALLTMRTDLGSALTVSKPLLAGDSAAYQFYQDYLREPLTMALDEAGQLSDDRLIGLSRRDRSLARACGFIESDISPLARFDSPSVRLLGAQLDSVAAQKYSLELYFMAAERLRTDLKVAINVATTDSARPDFNRQLQFIPVEITPRMPSSAWPEGEVIPVCDTLTSLARPTDITVGLFDPSGESGRYLKVEGVNSNHYRLNLDETWKR